MSQRAGGEECPFLSVEGAGTVILGNGDSPISAHAAVLQPDLLDTNTGFGGQAAEEPSNKFCTLAECCNILVLLFLLSKKNS